MAHLDDPPIGGYFLVQPGFAVFQLAQRVDLAFDEAVDVVGIRAFRFLEDLVPAAHEEVPDDFRDMRTGTGQILRQPVDLQEAVIGHQHAEIAVDDVHALGHVLQNGLERARLFT